MTSPPPSPLPSILIVDDDTTIIQILGRALSGLGRLRFAKRGQDAVRLATEETPDLLLLDAQLPDISGTQVWDALRGRPEFENVPMIFITSQGDEASEESGLTIGAMDFIVKPVRPAIVVARARTQLRLKAALDRLRQMATTDGLTGLANRRAFDERLASEWGRVWRNRRPISLLMIDVDYFKRFNDTYGHPAGDKVLAAVAGAVKSRASRPGDFAARYGGEEFVVVLPETDASGARVVAQSVGDAVAALALPHSGGIEGKVSVSIGGASFDMESRGWPAIESGQAAPVVPTVADPRVLQQLLGAADAALYAVKASGRSAVLVKRADLEPFA